MGPKACLGEISIDKTQNRLSSSALEKREEFLMWGEGLDGEGVERDVKQPFPVSISVSTQSFTQKRKGKFSTIP